MEGGTLNLKDSSLSRPDIQKSPWKSLCSILKLTSELNEILAVLNPSYSTEIPSEFKSS